MTTLANTIETLKTAKTTKGTYNKVLGIAQAIIEQRTIAFTQTKVMPIVTFEQEVICSLCDLLSMAMQKPASMRSEMPRMIERAVNVVNYKMGN